MTQIPSILGGRYKVGELIGRGGMAQVHKGYDARLSRVVAIKVLRSDLATDPTFLARFRREAQSAAGLNHPSIVAVYDTGEEQVPQPNGETTLLPYIVMEYVKGRTVSKLLSNGSALPIDEASQIVVGVLSALEYSHHEGIIHRDIKPGNIMITPNGNVKVMDFGIARAIADSSATMTSTNSVVGTAQYLSPEQARGEVVDARSDLYSTGCLFYELLTGRPPFQGDSAVAVAYQHVSETPKIPSSFASDIPNNLDRVVMKSLAKRRQDRYQSAEEMRADLLAALRGQQVEAPQINVWRSPISPTGAGAATRVTQAMPAGEGVPTSGLPETEIAHNTGAYPAQPTGYTGATTTNSDLAAGIAAEQAKRDQQRRKRRNIWIAVILSLLAIGGVAFAVYYSMANSEQEVTLVEVPDLTGTDQNEARKLIEDAGLKFAIGDPIESDEVIEGEFVSSDPQIGTQVEPGSTVTVHFSSGKGQITVPDIANGKYTQDDARQALLDLGLTVATVEIVDEPGVAKDIVVDIDPGAGTVVEKGSSITLYVASGEVEIVDVVGRSLSDAQATLGNLKVGVDTTQQESDEPKGTVIDQDPRSGKHPYDVRVKLTVSSGPPPEPVAPTEPEPQAPPAGNNGNGGNNGNPDNAEANPSGTNNGQ
ncbi:MAG: Stk1 family PASTA domain-containing Ser/Thr kinase [Actinomycetaceae bacterium]|nr:Stk1 family PASTA domain-containing Ser/Thr kinase [Arcanobacterium sp.]MDD7505115.1 Stk1 family PASTA domain-containing Ser/Thr kinase [Actinomycetaceae bacterium]